VQHRIDGSVDGDAVDDIVHDERETVAAQSVDVIRAPSREVVDRDDLPPTVPKDPTEVRSDEPGTSGHDRAGHQRPTPRYVKPM
jgi:hypothetical protein